MEWDVVVIGGGIGGLSAALRAAELGERAVVLEQGTDERYRCNSRFSGGIIHISYHDVKRPAAELLQIIRDATEDDTDMALAKAMAEDSSRYLDWLQKHGTKFMRFSPLEAHKWCMAPPRALAPGLDWEGRGPDVTLRLLTAKLKALGGELALSQRAKRLLMEDRSCVGVVSEVDGKEREWKARNVVICDGGFQADKELFEENIGKNFEHVLQRGAATGRGDGLRMAVAAGAKLTRKDTFYGHLLSRDSFANEKVWPYPELDAIAVAGIVVGADGNRVADEGIGGIALANALAKLPDPASTFAVFDETVWNGPGKSARIPANPFLEKAGGTVLRAGSVAELAAQMKVPAAALAATIEVHNKAVDSGNFSALTPPRREGKVKAMPVRTAPFMAIPLVPGITNTMGGIAIDEHGRVLSEADAPIPGLYAAGSSTGGLEGGGTVGYVSGLTKAGVFGMRSAEHIHSRKAA